jgi:hypothetical protein
LASIYPGRCEDNWVTRGAKTGFLSSGHKNRHDVPYGRTDQTEENVANRAGRHGIRVPKYKMSPNLI